MKIVEVFSKLLGHLLIDRIDERLSTLRIDGSISRINEISVESIGEFILNIPKRDDFRIIITIEQDDTLPSLTRLTNTGEYVEKFKDYFQHYEKDENITFSIEIDKNKVDNTISIYNFEVLNEFIEAHTSIEILKMFSDQKEDSKFLNYEYLEEDQHPFQTSSFRFGYRFNREPQSNSLDIVKTNCYFVDVSKFPYVPTDFSIQEKVTVQNGIIKHFDTLKSLFAVVAIFDYSMIRKETLDYKLKGYKLYQGEVQIDDDFYNKTCEYFNLYQWIYSSNGNITDKLGIARNIISLHITENNLKIDGSLIHSIKSAHNTYLKENVSNYLSLRSKILDELSWISQKTSEAIDRYLQAYKQSSLTIVTFFISIFLLRTLSNREFTQAFTFDITFIAFAFLFLLALYCFFSRYNIIRDRDRIKRKYFNVKNRYKDLLTSEDIDRILNRDSEFNYEESFINNRIRNYTWLWVITIILLVILLLAFSEIIPFSLFHRQQYV